MIRHDAVCVCVNPILLFPLLVLTTNFTAAGIGVALARDKLGNHVVSKVSKGSTADTTGLVREGVSSFTSVTSIMSR
jgi:hypothetical protein